MRFAISRRRPHHSVALVLFQRSWLERRLIGVGVAPMLPPAKTSRCYGANALETGRFFEHRLFP